MALGSGSFAQFVFWKNVVAKRDSVIDTMYIISLIFSGKCHMEAWIILIKFKSHNCIMSDLYQLPLNISSNIHKNSSLPRCGKSSCLFSQPSNHLAIPRLSPL